MDVVGGELSALVDGLSGEAEDGGDGLVGEVVAVEVEDFELFGGAGGFRGGDDVWVDGWVPSHGRSAVSVR